MRARLLSGASGRLLVVGLGPGHDLDHLPPAVTSVVAVEPSGPMRHAAAGRVDAARARGLEVDVLDAVAESLPLDDGSVDAVLTALVLCSVDDLAASVGETHRVLRPGGTLHVLEHVAAEAGTRTAALQRAVAPVWPRLAGGCAPTAARRPSWRPGSTTPTCTTPTTGRPGGGATARGHRCPALRRCSRFPDAIGTRHSASTLVITVVGNPWLRPGFPTTPTGAEGRRCLPMAGRRRTGPAISSRPVERQGAHPAESLAAGVFTGR
jgi:SAM-dependent methyltransferase